jgi:hypothetical protein
MLFRDNEALFEFLDGHLPELGPIVSTETYHVLRTGKINYDWKLPADLGGNTTKTGRSAARLHEGVATAGSSRGESAAPPLEATGGVT